MKRLLIIFISVFALLSLSDAQDLTPESVERRLERSNSRIEHERHGENAKTWVDRGIVFQDIFDVNIQYLYFGMSSDELVLFMGEPNERQAIETEAGVRNVYVYDNIDIHFENGRLVSWEETKVIHESPLEEAYSSFQKAIKIEEEAEDPGFFARIFSGSQERRLTDAFTRLNTQFVSQAVLAYEEANFEKAFSSFQYAVKAADSPYFEEPVDTSLIFNAGFVGTLADEHEQALEYLLRAKEMNYGEGNLYVLIKESYVALGDSTKAEMILQEGFEKFPEDNVVLVELVNFYIHARDPQSALDYLELAKRQEPDNPSFYYAEGALYDGLENPDKAIIAYEKALEIDPDMFDANFNMGVLYYNRAVKMLEEANEIMDNVEYEKARDEAFVELAKAVPYLERCYEVNPEHRMINDVMETLRIIYYRLGMEDELQEMNKKLGREMPTD